LFFKISSEKMKRCPGCGAITVDGSTVCGLCGSDLWGIEEEQLDVAVSETEKSQDVSESFLSIENRQLFAEGHLESWLRD
jgi:uncharacterized Zn finger protein (UPF0148 family)